MYIRQEEAKDHQEVFQLIKDAFKDVEYSDHKEQFLVERLRKSASFIPELSLVAVISDIIVGYILLTKIKIVQKNGQETPSLALAPVAVAPIHQGKGIGELLILKAHEIARSLHYRSIILLGHENYYPRFGYKTMEKYGINLPFEAPAANCMLIELTTNSLKDIQGTVVYPDAFFND